MAITTIQQATEVSEVNMVTISETVQDEENNVYVREVRAFGAADDSGTRPLLFTLRLTAPTAAALSLTAPVQTF
ncbi:hypothetical protein [Bradyrhizobium paxllaeri]|uniref:hypothetical protein n=1 Tax=Bradyrhizobium paxllaeri TaxID=190148 RepID=UPI0008107982|nr:hypothetical protein [Bradyrhizobium paxllaeri]